MKKIYTVLLACFACATINAATYTISINGNNTYSQPSLSANVGDVVTIQASSTHPLNQVDASTWNANGTATVAGGWGTQMSDYTFTLTTPGTIYYVCQNHAPSGMKGRIDVTAVGIKENTSLVKQFSLYPNPAVNTLNLNFSLTEAASVNAKMLNLLGQEVAELLPATTLPENVHNYKVELPANITAGTYFVIINVNDTRVTKKLVIAK